MKISNYNIIRAVFEIGQQLVKPRKPSDFFKNIPQQAGWFTKPGFYTLTKDFHHKKSN